MFVHVCTACEKRQLIFETQISHVTRADGALATSFTCWCGAEQTAIVDFATGTTRREARLVA